MGAEARSPSGRRCTLTEDKYLLKVEQWSQSVEGFELWRGLWGLSERPGWYIIAPDDEDIGLQDPGWCFGLAGACRVSVTVLEPPLLLAYIAEIDSEFSFPTLGELWTWLDEIESNYEGFTALQEELVDYLLPMQIDKWSEEE